jgi:plasmid stabilization system protein ParE
LRLIATLPFAGKSLGNNVRRRSLPSWHYWIIYRVQQDAIGIVAVAHARRRPDYWASRLR